MIKKLSFIIPAKNEEDSIEILYKELINEVKKLKTKYEIIFIDDGSTDRTFNIFEKLRKKDKNISVIKLRGNWGKSVALSIGFEKASGDIVFTLDADLQDNPKDIPSFIKKINEGNDLVSGWKKRRKDPISKTIPSKVMNSLVRLLTGLKIHDMNCGFKAYKKDVVKDLNLHGDLYRFIPIIAQKQNFKVDEVIVSHRRRKYGKSKYGIKRLLSGWLDLLTVFFLVRYLRRPGHFFGFIGLVMIIIGTIIGFYISFLEITTGSIQFHYPLLFLGVMLIILGVNLLMTGLLAEMIIHFEGKQNYQNIIVSNKN
ncbi:MAG TPA: glycosyltransferase family 2 protein [Patescibacteria group bacterium]|nr:glycosyltransferase family 2 protein [Patescibacteria group bacterium]